MFQSNSKYYIKSTISSTQADGTTFLLSPDFEQWLDLETGSSVVSMVLKNGTQTERFEITATGWVATIVKRWLDQSATVTEDVLLQKQWADGTIAYVTALSFDLLDKQWDTMTGALNFSGTTHSGITVNRLTTTQRDALSSVTDGTIIYNTTAGEFQIRQWGAWSTMSSGSTQPNATTTVAGKVEIATTAETIAGTDTGGTGANLLPLPSDIAKNIQSSTFVYGADAGWDDTYVVALTPTLAAYTAGQRLRMKVTTSNTGACSADFWPGPKNIKDRDGNDPVTGQVFGTVDLVYDGTNLVLESAPTLAQDTDITTGTNQIRSVTPKQLQERVFNTRTIGHSSITPLTCTASAYGWQLIDGSSKDVTASVKVTGPYTSLSSIVLNTLPQATANGNVVLSVTLYRDRLSTTQQTDTDQRAYTYNATSAQALNVSVNSAAFNGITLQDGDIVSIRIQRVGADGSDTFAGDVILQGVTVTFA